MEKDLKDILLKDLCARLPYGVRYNYGEYDGCDYTMGRVSLTAVDDFPIENVKPYLFPLSSMTEEQEREWQSLMICDVYGVFYHTIESFDYLYKNHIDIRGLIPMGLAIDATGLNIY